MIISNLFQIGFLTYLGYKFLKFKNENKRTSCLKMFLIYLIVCALNFNGLSNGVAFGIFIAYFTYINIQFKSTWTKKLLILVSFYMMVAISETITMMLMNFLIDLNKTTHVNSFEYCLSLVVSNLILFYMIKIFVKVTEIFNKYSLPKYTWIIFILPVITIIMLLSLSDFYKAINENKVFIIIIIGLFISNIILLILYVHFIINVNNKKELELSKYKEKYSSTKYELLDNQYRNSFNFLHDFLNEFQKISTLMNNKEYEQANTILTKLTEKTFNSFNNIYSNSLILNTILNTKTDLLNKNNIKVYTVIEYNDLTFIDFCDQIDLFGNLLDYAINNTIESEEHETIIIKTKLIGEMIVMQYKFGYTNDCEEEKIINIIKPTLSKYHADVSVKALTEDVVSVIIIFKDKTIDYSKEC